VSIFDNDYTHLQEELEVKVSYNPEQQILFLDEIPYLTAFQNHGDQIELPLSWADEISIMRVHGLRRRMEFNMNHPIIVRIGEILYVRFQNFSGVFLYSPIISGECYLKDLAEIAPMRLQLIGELYATSVRSYCDADQSLDIDVSVEFCSFS
jgi:hypothetical protein